MLSDILMSGEIQSSAESAAFRRGDIGYTPHMFTSYKVGDPVGIYFEVYNLMYNAAGLTGFRVSCTLTSDLAGSPSRRIAGYFRRLFGGEEAKLGTSYDYAGNAQDEHIYMNFELPAEDTGEHKLTVSVMDLNSGISQSRDVRLTIN